MVRDGLPPVARTVNGNPCMPVISRSAKYASKRSPTLKWTGTTSCGFNVQQRLNWIRDIMCLFIMSLWHYVDSRTWHCVYLSCTFPVMTLCGFHCVYLSCTFPVMTLCGLWHYVDSRMWHYLLKLHGCDILATSTGFDFFFLSLSQSSVIRNWFYVFKNFVKFFEEIRTILDFNIIFKFFFTEVSLSFEGG